MAKSDVALNVFAVFLVIVGAIAAGYAFHIGCFACGMWLVLIGSFLIIFSGVLMLLIANHTIYGSFPNS